jgi:hypothetical protein
MKNGRRQRNQRRNNAAELHRRHARPICNHCGRPGAHFAPPSLGEPGFWICQPPIEPLDAEYQRRQAFYRELLNPLVGR